MPLHLSPRASQFALIPFVLFLTLVFTAVGRPHSTASGLDIGNSEAFWWMDLSSEHLATAWIGPNLDMMDGTTWRNWVMQYTACGSDQPLVYMASLVGSDDSDSIQIEGQDLSIRLKPRDALAWRLVVSAEDLDVVIRPAPSTGDLDKIRADRAKHSRWIGFGPGAKTANQ